VFPGRVLAAAAACAALLGAPALAAAVLPAPTATDCADASPATVLVPSADAMAEARAYWLDRSHLHWPGQAGAARYVLAHSADGQLRRRGDRLQGADERIVLDLDTGGLPAGVAERFKFVGAGRALSLPAAVVPRLPELLRGQLWLVAEDRRGRVLDATGLQSPGALDDWYAAAARSGEPGAVVGATGTAFTLWAPTARNVALCLRRPR
jgi:hypothetical protein